MVSGIGHLGVIDCACYSKQETFLQEPAREIFAHDNAVGFCRDARFTVHPGCGTIRIQPAADIVSSAHRAHRIVLHYHSGDNEKGFLREGEILKTEEALCTHSLRSMNGGVRSIWRAGQ
jgi:hypothetical protein